MHLDDITFCRVIKCSLETYEFHNCTIRLKMQELMIVDFVGPASARSYKIGVVRNGWLVGW